MVSSGKKLLVLDINGLLLDTYFQGEPRPDRPHDAKVNRFYVYKRAFCEEFIQFSLQNFIVGVWSSAREHNVLSLVDFMFKEAKEKLAFIWHQEHCTDTGVRHPDNKYKPVFLKELSKLWEKFEADLPWAKGDYGPSNTLLIDDSPYKAISNPRHTAIFPKTYKATDPDDNFLAEELLPYLKRLLEEKDVQNYIQRNPIGESSISPSDPQWSQILKSDQFKNEEEPAVSAHVMAIGAHVMVSSNNWMRSNNLRQDTGGAAPQLVGAEPQTWNTGHRGKRLKRSDYIECHVGTFDSEEYACDFNDRGTVPSRCTSRNIRDDQIRKNPMPSTRSGECADISEEADRPHNDFRSQRRDVNMSSVRSYQSRTSGSSNEPETFRDELRDRHRGSSWDRAGSLQAEVKSWKVLARKQERSKDRNYGEHCPSSSERRSSPRRLENMSLVRDIRRRASSSSDELECSRGESRDRHQGKSRHREGPYQSEDKRKRCSERIRERSIGRHSEEPLPRSSEWRSSPIRDHRREDSQYRSKPRESREPQRLSEKETPRKRYLSPDSQRYDHGVDGARHTSGKWRSRRSRD